MYVCKWLVSKTSVFYLRKVYKPDFSPKRWIYGIFFQSILQITKLRTGLVMTSLGSGVGVRRQSQVRTSCVSVSSVKLDPEVGVLFFLPFFLSLHPFIRSFPSFLSLFLFFSELLGLLSHSLARRTWPVLLSDLFRAVDFFFCLELKTF